MPPATCVGELAGDVGTPGPQPPSPAVASPACELVFLVSGDQQGGEAGSHGLCPAPQAFA